jgi:hypothetical protein
MKCSLWKQSDITIDEFFAIRCLLNGSKEDFLIGKSNLKNLNYNDMGIVNILFAKSLSLAKRNRFILSIDVGPLGNLFSYHDLIGKSIYKTIVQRANKKIYKQILYEIMKN